MLAMRIRSTRSLLVCGAAAIGLIAATPAWAQQRTFDVPAQPANKAIPEFARQAGVQIVAPGSALRGKRTAPLKGEHDVRAALRQLLQGTHLRVASDDGVTITLARGEVGNGGSGGSDGALLGGGTVPVGRDGIAEILVVGSRSQNVDIRRSEDDPQPYVVFTSDDVQKSQTSNVEDFLKTRLPMNAVQQTKNQYSSTGTTASNLSSVNLRGLGVNQTLILIDGRRAPRVLDFGQDFTQADINGIPISAIDRIEILPSTAGGIYGGGGIGGVVNIIRKRDYRGLDLRLDYGGTFRGGGERFGIELSGGFSPNHGHTQVSFSFSHSKAQPLQVGDRPLWRRGRELVAENQPVPAPLNGYTPNIQAQGIFDFGAPGCFVDGVLDLTKCFSFPDLVLDDGTQLGAIKTYVPIGYAGLGSDGGAALVANAGGMNLDLTNDSRGSQATLLAQPRLRSANVNVRQEIGSTLEAFADFSISENRARGRLAGNLPGLVVLSADSPGNPFQQNILVSVPIIGLDRPSIGRAVSTSFTGGLIAELGADWAVTAEYGWSQARNRATHTSNPLTQEGLSALNDGSFDLLRDLNRFPIDFGPYLASTPDSFFGPFKNSQTIASLRISGSPLRLPGGKLGLTALVEHRQDLAKDGVSTDTASHAFYPARQQVVDSAYLELRAPLVEPSNNISLISSMEIQASVRHDHYATRVASPGVVIVPTPSDPLPPIEHATTKLSSTNYTLALQWRPVPDVALRASYATGFLPPSISQLVARPNEGPLFTFTDPLRGNEFVGMSAPFDYFTGGNPNLAPERSKSLSAGIILTPSFLPGARLSADYTRIRKTGEISTVAEQDIINNADAYPGRVVRGPNLPGDPAGFAGPIIHLDAGLLNVASSRTEAFDFQGDFEFGTRRFGQFHLYGIATLQTKLRRELLPTSVSFNMVGFRDGPLRWRGNAGLDWTLGRVTARWNIQYYDGYRVAFADPSNRIGTIQMLQLQGASHIPSQSYHDLGLSYQFGDGRKSLLSGLKLSLGIQNAFDKKPPVIADTLYGYSLYGDPRLRRFTVSLRKQFGL